MIQKTLNINPAPKDRTRQIGKTWRRRLTDRTRAYQDAIRFALKDEQPFKKGEPLILWVHFYVPMPQSWSKARRERMESELCGRAKGDIDNLLKAFMDGLQPSPVPNDAQIAAVGTSRRYSREPRVEFLLRADGEGIKR